MAVASTDGDKEGSNGPSCSRGDSRALLGRVSGIPLTLSPLAFNKGHVSQQSIALMVLVGMKAVTWASVQWRGEQPSQVTSLETWRPASESSIIERENCIPGFWQLASKWRPQGERAGITKSKTAVEQWAAVGLRRDRLDTKPNLLGECNALRDGGHAVKSEKN